jgi:hypothetical protein
VEKNRGEKGQTSKERNRSKKAKGNKKELKK